MPADLIGESALLRRYGAAAQRFACYPGREHFSADLNGCVYHGQLQLPLVGGIAPALSLYVHGPRDKALAAYLGAPASWSKHYLYSLARELDLLVAALAAPRTVSNLYCRADAAYGAQLLDIIGDAFDLAARGERVLDTELCRLPRDGTVQLFDGSFNQLRIEIRDPVCRACATQAADLKRAVQQAHDSGFKTVELRRELDGRGGREFLPELTRLIDAAPERLIIPTDTYLATPTRAGLEFLRTVEATLAAADYVYFGMDYFVRGNDPLLQARRRGGLGYGLRGFSVGANSISLGLGPTAISKLQPYYGQNEDVLTRYLAALDQRRLPVQRGMLLSSDDQMRRAVMQALICQLEVPFESINAAYLVDFKQYFAPELAQLQQFARAGAVELSSEWLSVTPDGRRLLPAVCAVFDAYRNAGHTP
jgi:oxygen-independent coproporphyrinogen-3 oxidase